MLERKIQYFIDVVQEGSFSSAAKKYLLSQSAISQQITQLENEIGVILFDRSGYKPKLTNQGKVFYEGCLKLQRETNELLETIQQEHIKIRIGLTQLEQNKHLIKIIMSVAKRDLEDNRKVTTHRLIEMKQRGEKISMLTAYDYSMAQLIDQAGMDVILVGDSASNVMAGNVTTLPITLDQMIYHGKSVMKAVKRALVVVDLPFGTYQGNSKEALASAIRVMKETHADCIKLEGGSEIRESIERILCAGIPVMGHLGLTPQSINKFGTYTVRAREEAEAKKLIADAHLLEEIGCFAIVLEKIPAALAAQVASELTIPIIGIGAGGGVDGQVLVMHDMLGINQGFSPRFLRRYANLAEDITRAVQTYIEDVKTQDFPNEKEQY